MARTWKVIGGGDKGGLVVRSGKSLTSEQLPERLSTGALVKELKLEGERLQFQRETGAGPETGWVSLKLKDKELLSLVEGEKPAAAPAKDSLKKKSWDTKFLFKGCGANVRALEGGTEGASRDQLFEHLMRQHVSPELRRDFWDQIPEHLYDTGQTNETDCITFFQTVGHLCPAEGRRLASPGGIRQRVEKFGEMKCIVVECDAEPKVVAVLCHGIEVLGDDLYTLAHNLCAPGLRLVLPEALNESAQPREEGVKVDVGLPIDESQNTDEWRKPLREWWSRNANEKEVKTCLSRAVEALEECVSSLAESSPGAKLVLGGFSQGAAVALAAAGKVKPAGLLLMCPPGFCASMLEGAPKLDAAALVAAGNEDPIAPRAQVEEVHKALAGHGASVEPLLAFEGGHEVTMTVVEAAKAFLAKVAT